MPNNTPKVIITNDGSSSIYLPELDERYHSIHGAITESVHVFINAGLRSVNKDAINVLEIGFGTGLNALLTLLESTKLLKHIDYHCLEPFPIGVDILSALNYLEFLKISNYADQFRKLHQDAWGQKMEIDPLFAFTKSKLKVQDFETALTFDVIYFDAFAPDVQPDMWTKEVFTKMHTLLKPEGRLVTYCAKGSVKRTLVEVGFMVESLSGPPGKREMVRAIRLPD